MGLRWLSRRLGLAREELAWYLSNERLGKHENPGTERPACSTQAQQCPSGGTCRGRQWRGDEGELDGGQVSGVGTKKETQEWWREGERCR